MTNSELIAHAKHTMKELFEASGGKFMEHEQAAQDFLPKSTILSPSN